MDNFRGGLDNGGVLDKGFYGNKINSKKPYFNRENLKGSKHQREENYYIFGVATSVKYQVLYVWVASILNAKIDVIIDDEVRVSYYYIIKIPKFLNSFSSFFKNKLIKIMRRGRFLFEQSD